MMLIKTVVCLAMLYSSAVLSISVIPQLSSDSDDEITEVVGGDPETINLMDQSAEFSSRHGGRTNFTVWDLFPTYFGEFFEIFVFFMELKWHYEIEDAIAEASGRIDEHVVNDGTQHHDDNFLLDFAKHYFVNNNTPLWKFKA